MAKRRAVRGAWVGLYGNVAIPRGYCPDCRRSAFLFDGKLACCDRPIDGEPDKFKRELCPIVVRSKPPPLAQQAVLRDQDQRCFYCRRRFGDSVVRRGRIEPIRLRVHWDHLVPFVYLQNNRRENFVAACHVCNLLKADRCFLTVEEAQDHVAAAWKAKGYENL